MTIMRTRLNEGLEQALERYRHAHPDVGTDEAIVQKALKRFFLEEGYLVEDEALSDAELAALQSVKEGERDYVSWNDVKDTL